MPFKYNPITNQLDITSAAGGGGGITSINTIPPDGGGNFTLAAGTNMSIVPGTNSLTLNASGGSSGVVVNQYRAQSTAHTTTMKTLNPKDAITSANTELLDTITLTPSNSTNILLFEWSIPCDSGSTLGVSFSIFNGTTLLTSSPSLLGTGGGTGYLMNGCYYMLAGSTSSITFNFSYVGYSNAPVLTEINNSPLLVNGTCAYSIIISEINPSGGSIPLTPITNVTFIQSPYTVLSTDQFLSVDTSGGAITLNFPNSTTAGRGIIVKDESGNAFTNNITFTTPGGTTLFDGSTSGVLNTNYQSDVFVFSGTKYEII